VKMTQPKHLELFIRSDGGVVAQCRTESNGRLDDPVSLATAGEIWNQFRTAWGAAQLQQIEALTAERDALQTDRDQLQAIAGTLPGLQSQIESLTAERDELAAEVARLTALVPPPLAPREVTAEEFLARFSDSDRVAIGLSQDPRAILAQQELFTRVSRIDLDSPRLQALIDALVDAGIPIDTEDRARIFA